MQASHRTTAIILALLSVPFGVAIYQDANAKPSEFGRFGGPGYGGLFDDEYPPEPYDDSYLDELYDDELYDLNAELQAIEEPQTMGADFFDAVFFDDGKAKAPTLSGPLAGAAPGSSLSAFAQKNPDYEEWEWEGLPGYDEAGVNITGTALRVENVAIEFPDDGSAARLMGTQWGTAAMSLNDSYARRQIWFNADQKIRAELLSSEYDSATVTFARYQTLEELIAPRAKLFGFEDKDLFALSPKELEALVGATDAFDSVSLSLPALEGVSESSMDLIFEIEEEKVVEATLEFSFQDSSRLLRLLKSKFGKLTTEKDYDSTTYTFAKGGRIIELTVYPEDGEYDSKVWHSLSVRRK